MEVYTFFHHPRLLSLHKDDEERAGGENGQGGGVEGVCMSIASKTHWQETEYELTITAFNPEQQNRTSCLVPPRVTDVPTHPGCTRKLKNAASAGSIQRSLKRYATTVTEVCPKSVTEYRYAQTLPAQSLRGNKSAA
ncbi:hypothetical protein DPX16_13512 [Anabarilius grahami]|uniref:Uncharacterized protein n=1 Tax=Anabarilius grahami TaxID=495550 RepID=A0A3N0YCI8_ANAGA|nr:hypothetical protein DPX16_13512 [Anabarilius grahami]